MLTLVLLRPIFHSKLCYPRARSAIPCFIEHSVQLFKIARYLECRVSQDRPIRKRLTAGWEYSLLVSRCYDRSDGYMSSESHYDGIVFRAPWMAATIWLLAAMTKRRNSQLVYIIHLAAETGNCAWEMNERSIPRELLWPIYKSETSNEVWISDTPPRWPHRQNNWL